MNEFILLLQQSKFILRNAPMETYNANSKVFSVVKAIITAGLYPNVVRIQRPPGSTNLDYLLIPYQPSSMKSSQMDDRVHFHPSSYLAAKPIPRKYQWLVHHSKVRSSRVFIRDSTFILPYALLLFGGPITVYHERQQVQVGDWVLFQTAPKTGVVFKQLRALLDQVLQKKITEPSLNIMQASNSLMETINSLLQNEEKELEL